MNHCVAEVRKFLQAFNRVPNNDHDIGVAQHDLGEHIIKFAEAWETGNLENTAMELQEIVWHSIALSELLDLPTHALFLDVRNQHVAGVPMNAHKTLEDHYESKVVL